MKSIFALGLLFYFFQTQAQVGINTTAPNAQLEIKASNSAAPSNSDGIIIPRINAFPAINPTAAQQGMMVYLATASGANAPGFYYWDNATTSWVGIISTANGDKDWYKAGTTTSPSNTDSMYHMGNVGIGHSNPSFPLHFGSVTGDKISFFGGPGIHHGIGIQDYLLQIHGGLAVDDIAFGYGTSASMTEVMRIKGTGQVGIGTSTPAFPLSFGPSLGDKIALYGSSGVHFGLGIQNNLFQIHASNNTDDIAFGYGNSASFTERVRIKGSGNVGIGTSTPSSKLHISNGTSGITANGSSLLTVEGSGTNVYTNLLSTQETGVLFGAGSSSANGGIVYNSVTFPNSMMLRTGGNTNRMIIGATGNVALGNFTPDYPLHFPGTLGDKISLYGGTGVHYGLGIQNSLLQIHTSIASDDIAFGYGSSSSFNELVRIKGNGNVGIGTNPVFPLHFSDGYGDKVSLWGSTVANHYGFGIQNKLLVIHSDYDFSDIAFGYGNSTSFTERMRIKGTGEVGIGTTAPTAELEVNGFTKLGTTAPAVKMIKLTGTTGASQGNQATINHGLTSSKILAVNVFVEYSTGNSVPPSYTASNGFEYDYYVTATQIIVWTKSANSASILSKPIRILVTYEE